MDKSQAQIIIEFRNEAEQNDSKELQEKRRSWLNKLNVINWNGNFETNEMLDVGEEVVKTAAEKYQFFNPKLNTRTKIKSETCLETDKIKDIKKAFGFIEEIGNSLIRAGLHFVIFYAKGQRSPHIRIYDFEELKELNPKQRIKAQILFWRKHVPFGLFQLIDSGMFVDDKTYQIEFSPHYKYRTPFNLLFEYLPEEEKCNI